MAQRPARRRKPAAPAPAPAATPANWRSRIVGHAEVDPREITPHPLNPRRHPDEQHKALRSVLGEIGWIQDVVINRTTGHMLDGHARVEDAIATNQPTVPVTYVEVTEGEELLALATFDPLGALAEIDEAAMTVLVSQAREAEIASQELVQFLATLPGVTPETPPEYPEAEQPEATYMVLIECADEPAQTALLDRLGAEGLKCRALLS